MKSWSGLRKKVREHFAPPLEKLVDIHFTSYEVRGEEGREKRNSRFWLTFDGEEVFSIDRVSSAVRADSFTPESYVEATRTYLQLSIEDARRCEHPLPRALALLDRRTGKGGLAKNRPAEDEHALVHLCYTLRLRAPDRCSHRG